MVSAEVKSLKLFGPVKQAGDMPVTEYASKAVIFYSRGFDTS